jgi:PrcB C-terminal
MLALVLTALTGFAAAGPAPGAKEQAPLKKDLFANEAWYKAQKGEERTFVGVLRRVERGKGVVGFGRFNPYRLEMDEKGKKDVREVYVGGKPDLLAPYVGKRVKLTGKAVDMEVEGRNHREIWPARLELLQAEPPREKPVPFSAAQAPNPSESPARPAQGEDKPAAGKALKIIARGNWSPGKSVPDEKPHQLVLRSAAELAARPPWNRSDAPPAEVQKAATAALAKALKVPTIDWDRQMLVIVTAGVKRTGGWKVHIDSVSAADKTVTVRYRVTPPQGFATQAFTHPGEAVLVERAEGTPKFEMAPGAKPRPKLRPRPEPKPAEPPLRTFEVSQKDGKGKELKVYASFPGRPAGAAPRGHMVIRGGPELTKVMSGLGGNIDKATAQLAQQLKVDKIDWDKQMVLLVSGGTQRTGGYRVELTGLKVKDDVLTVHWKLMGPRPGQPVTQALTHPALTVLVQRYDDEIRFDPATAKSGVDR